MDTKKGYSFVIVGNKSMFPEVVGKPQWISETTIVLPVKLKPGREYSLGINSEQHQNFRGTNGLPAVPYPLSFYTDCSIRRCETPGSRKESEIVEAVEVSH